MMEQQLFYWDGFLQACEYEELYFCNIFNYKVTFIATNVLIYMAKHLNFSKNQQSSVNTQYWVKLKSQFGWSY